MATESHLSSVWYRVSDLQVTHGLGSTVFTADGEEYLDFTAGIAVTSTGHCHPKVVAAIQRQAERFIHAQVNCYTHDLLEPLAARLAELSPAGIDTFFFANSGAEITEAAVKLAKQATGRPHTIVFSGSFHGRTHMAMAMTTSKTVYRAGHAPLPAGVFVAPFPQLAGVPEEEHDRLVDEALHAVDFLLKAQTAPEETAAMILEPVLGEGGYIPAPARFIHGLVERCRQHGILFIADEVQSGMGRTGKVLAVEHYDLEPDIVCMAKGIASGFPLSALGTRRELSDRWTVGSHGGTYGGNPMGCAAALATLEVITEPGFLDHVNARGEQLRAGVTEIGDQFGGVVEVRGLGLMNGTQFEDPDRVAAVQAHMLNEGHVITMNAGTYGNCLRWMPPLVVTEAEVDRALSAFAAAMKVTAS